MNREQLVEVVAGRLSVSKTTAENVLREAFAEITAKLAAGERVDIHEFGRFAAKEHKARKGFSIVTKTSIPIPARTRAKFTEAKKLTESLNPAGK